MRSNALVNKFNRGEVSPLASSRPDLVVTDTCDLMENWVPMRLGPMAHRPGAEHLGTVPGLTYLIPFVFGTDDKAILEFTAGKLRVWVDDELITRTATTSTVINGEFATNLDDWTDADEGGTAASSHSGEYGGSMLLVGDGAAAAIRRQTMATEVDVETVLRITVDEGPIDVKLGYTAGASDIYAGTLEPGVHSLAFTPSSNVVIQFSNKEKYTAYVSSVAVEGTGIFELPTDLTEDDLALIRPTQSADVVFMGVEGIPPFKIERRGIRSWSVAEYLAFDGPFQLINTSTTTLTVGAIEGDTTITASSPLFSVAEHENAAIRIDSSGQTVSQDLSGEAQQTGPIRVTGIGTAREFQVNIVGTWSASVTLQRSAGGIGSWTDVETYTTNQSKTYDDNFDNAIMYYRLAIKTGDYTSGTAEATLSYSAGSITGYAKITKVTSTTTVNCKVFKDFGSTDATLDWYVGEWSAGNGYPTACDIFEGRLWWVGKNKIWGSVSDNYYSFDNTLEGDSRSITRTIGFGAVDIVNWIFASTRLCIGTAGTEVAIRSTSFNEPLTATTANLKRVATQGSSRHDIAEIGRHGYYVQHAGTRVIELIADEGGQEFVFFDLMTAHPEIGLIGIRRVVPQHQPELRIHAVLNDGTVIVNLQEEAENLRAWYRIKMDGLIEDVCVVKGGLREDDVYYVVNRDGTRTLEKFAQITECRGETVSKHFDSHVQLTSPGTSVATHIANGTEVGIWGDGKSQGTATVSGGNVTLPAGLTDVVYGIEYKAKYVSPKLGYALNNGSSINQIKKITHIGLSALYMAPGALKYGDTFDNLYDLPEVENGGIYDPEFQIPAYDTETIPFDGTWGTDSRVVLQATAPVTVLSTVYNMAFSEKL